MCSADMRALLLFCFVVLMLFTIYIMPLLTATQYLYSIKYSYKKSTLVIVCTDENKLSDLAEKNS